jgi:hypothetical protein
LRSVAIALLHHPVLDRDGETVTTAITNLDLHDMARSARTYGLERLYIVHPVAAQRALAERIREHWVTGSGKRRIPDRATALEVLEIVPAIEDVFTAVAPLGGRAGLELWTTAASSRDLSTTSYKEARGRLETDGPPVLIAFGTGWGLGRDLVLSADVRLEPIHARAATGFNHLSVRAACAITLDRLLGP